MRKYLVIQLARFGDVMQTKRLLASLLAENAEVHLCLDHSLADLATLVYPDCVLHPITAHASGLDAASGAARILLDNRHVFSGLQGLSFDRIYNLNFSGLNFRLATLFESARVVGYSMHNGQERVSRWPELAMRWSKERRIGLNLVDFWGCYADHPLAPQLVNPVAQSGGQGVGVVLAGRESRRSLPMEVLARIVTSRHARVKGAVYLFGSASESSAARALKRLLPSATLKQTVDITGKTNWAELIDAVKGLDVLLTPDTGTMHLAAHLGVPVEAFFLSSAWCFETGPYGEGHVVYQSVTECSPCLESQPCPYETKCLAPFKSDELLRYLSTEKPEHCPHGLVPYGSRFDSMGLTFSALANVDVDSERREKFRNFLAPHAKTKPVKSEFEYASQFASGLYLEKDWVV